MATQTYSQRMFLKDFAKRNFLRAGAVKRFLIWLVVLGKKWEINNYHNHIFRMTHERDELNENISKELAARLKLESEVKTLEQRL